MQPRRQAGENTQLLHHCASVALKINFPNHLVQVIGLSFLNAMKTIVAS